jgi:hypothetical protein
MIIDIHAHTTDHKLWGLHTESASIETLEKLALKHGVKKIVLLATYFPLKKSGLKNGDLLERIRGKELFSALGSLDMTADIAAGIEELEGLLKTKSIIGIKLYPGYQDFDPGKKIAFPVYELAQSYRVPVMFHGGELHGCCPAKDRQTLPLRCGYDHCRLFELADLSRPPRMSGAFKNFPGVTFIVSHLANEYFSELRYEMSQYGNVFTDISGQFVSGSGEATEKYKMFITREIKKFIRMKNGIDRIMFGTDFPIQSYQDSIDLVRRLRLRSEDEEKLFFDNAAFVLHLNGKTL